MKTFGKIESNMSDGEIVIHMVNEMYVRLVLWKNYDKVGGDQWP